MAESEVLKIDLDEVIRSRAPKVHRFTPRFLIRSLERLICQDRMNEMLQANRGREGADFCRGVLEHLDIECDVVGLENLPSADDESGWRVLFVSNHPLGGLDGMTLIKFLTEAAPMYDMRFIVNDLLMNISPLKPVFLPVNTMSGKQSKQAALDIDSALAGDIPIAIFPAGLCSRLINGRVQDVAWNKMFVNKAIKYHRDIIPLHFKGENSGFFYKFAKLRKASGIPVNLEMSLLPREVFRNQGSRFRISIGSPISWASLSGGANANAEAQQIREKVYSLER